jgi:hypothetical protein
LFLCLIGFLIPELHAQEVTTQGKEFWLSFIGNGFKYHPDVPAQGWIRVQLLVSAKRDCEGTITNPNTGWTRDFNVEANNIFSIDLEEEQVYVESSEYEQVVNKGLIITTTDTVSVYCANIATYSFDASYVLPTPGLADDYIIQTYEQSAGTYDPTSAFVIVATEDNTTIDITPSVTTLGGRPAHQEFSITLNRGQAYQLRSNTSFGNRDLSGTRVTARDCKKIAIFNGNNLTLIPTSAMSDSDCVFEQAMPLHSWGKKFVVTSSLDRNEDYVKITSAANGNEILKNGTHLCTLDANASYTFKLSSSDKSCYLEATHSCAVYLYNTSSNGWGNGAPSMVWIAPIEQRIDEITFSTFNYEHNNVNISKHYVNIIVQSQDIDQVYLDNTLLPSNQFESVAGSSQYSFFRKQITHGVHQLSCPNGFNAHVYGFGDARGYAYMVGSKATDLSSSVVVNDMAIDSYDTVSNCTSEPITFYADINLSNYELLWEFGDGTTSTDNPAVHSYDENLLYEVNLTVTAGENPCEGSSSSANSVFYIDARTEPDLDYTDQICAGQLYNGYGFNDILISGDTLLSREEPGAFNPNCIRRVNVTITCYPVSDTTVTDLVCFKGPSTYTGNGFNTYYDAPGNYTDSRIEANEFGCDRTVYLELFVGDLTEGDTQIETGHCDHFEWNGNTYYSPGFYSDTIPNDDGCYTVVHLDLEMGLTPNPSEIYPADTANTAPHWVVTATEFQIFSYDFALSNNDETSQWDSIRWKFENPNLHWALLPDSTTQPIGLNCRIYVMEHVNDTVWLDAIVYNQCGPQGVVRRYWFISSFYGIEEDGPTAPSTGSGAANFEVIPNPNNGQMRLNFESLIGKIDIKVFDSQGALVDQFQVDSETDSYSLPYECKSKVEGLYFFVATCKNIVLTKKVIFYQ